MYVCITDLYIVTISLYLDRIISNYNWNGNFVRLTLSSESCLDHRVTCMYVLNYVYLTFSTTGDYSGKKKQTKG